MEKMVGWISAVITCLHLTTSIALAAIPKEVPKKFNNTDIQNAVDQLIRNHPREEVSEKLYGWVISQQVLISYIEKGERPDMEIGFAEYGGKWIPAIVFNPAFLIYGSSGLSAEMNLKKKHLLLFHAYQYLKGHMDGTMPLKVSVLSSDESPEESARFLWHRELNVLRADWKFVQEMKAENLLSIVQKAVERYGEELGLIEALNTMLKSSAYPNINSTEIRAALQKIYEYQKSLKK